MKKKLGAKRLTLHRETLLLLPLRQVAGGDSGAYGPQCPSVNPNCIGTGSCHVICA